MFKVLLLTLSLASAGVYTPETFSVDPGTYPVSVGYQRDEGEASKTAYVTVGSENYITEGDIAIDANDITTTYDQKLSHEYLIQVANAKAWNTSTNESYKITDVKVDQAKEQVTFETVLGVETSVKLNVITREELYDMYNETNECQFIEMKAFDNYIEYILFRILIFTFAFTLTLFIYMQLNANKRFKEIDVFYKKLLYEDV